MRRWVTLGVVVGGACALFFAACGIDQSGLLGPDVSVDVTVTDASFDAPTDTPTDVPLDVPMGCTTLDATACVDAAPPSGWSYAAVALVADAACPAPTVYSQQLYVGALALQPGACACGCTPEGTWACSGTLSVSTKHSSCMNSATFDAGPMAGCIDVSGIGGNDDYIQVQPSLTAMGNGVGCDAGERGTIAWSSTPVTACIASSCSANYCGVVAPFQRCILSTTAQATCPAPFKQSPVPMRVGPTGNVKVTCSACSCNVVPAPPCGATFEAYQNSNCTGDLGAATGSCNNPTPGTTVNGIYYTPSTSPVQCVSNDGGAGKVDFTSAAYVCCLP